MAGLVPAIHVLDLASKQDVDARDKRGHDDGSIGTAILRIAIAAALFALLSQTKKRRRGAAF